jgi:hypothetical protein
MTLTIDPSQAAAAVANSTAAGVGALDCPFCTRVGLPILPVRYAVVDAHGGEWPAGLPWAMATYANGNYPSPGHARYVLRLMREGYLYLYDEARQRWQAWMITADSRLCEFPPRGRPPTAQDDEHVDAPCNVPANNLSALLISLPDADQARVLHVAYSDHRWTASMLDAMAANDDGIRDRVMQPFDVEAWLAHQQAPSATLPQDIATYLPEFSGADMTQLFGGDCFPYPGAGARQLLDAEQLIERMNWIVRDTPELIDKGAVLAIEDPIGITASLNQFRNNARVRLDGYARREDIIERKVTSEIIQGIRATFEEAAADRADAHIEHIETAPLPDLIMDDARRFEALSEKEQQVRWERMNAIQRERLRQGQEALADLREAQERNAPQYRQRAIDQSWSKYLERYDESARRDFESEYQAHVDHELEGIDQLARVHAQWMLSRAVAGAMASYDTGSLADGQVYEEAAAAMVTGMSVTTSGSDTLGELLDRPLDDPGSLIWRAFFLNQRSVLEQVRDYAFSAADWGSRLYGPLSALITASPEGRSRLGNLLLDTVSVMAHKLGILEATQIANHQLARIWQAVGWVRYGIRTSLLHYHMTAEQLAVLYDERLWRGEIAIHTMRGDPRSLAPLSEALMGGEGEQRLWALVPDTLDSRQRTVIDANRGESMELARQRLNQAMTPGVWGGLFAIGLEIINVWRAVYQLDGASPRSSLGERRSNLVASSAALTSALSSTANRMMFGAGAPESSVFRRLTWTAGMTAAVASWIGAYWMFSKVEGAAEKDDLGMIFAYTAAGLTATFAGLSTLAASAQAVGIIRGTEAAIGRFVISRAGWGVVAAYLGWATLGVTLVTLYVTPDDLEIWLERGAFGNRHSGRFEDLQAALDALQDMTM